MSEMLGNYYFMTNRYQPACNELEDALEKRPSNKAIRKKLILCYLALGNVDKGFRLFQSLAEEDISVITSAMVDSSCPCDDILNSFEHRRYPNLSGAEYYKVLAILWLYRDIEMSLKYFKKVKSLNKNEQIDSILKIISEHAGAQ